MLKAIASYLSLLSLVFLSAIAVSVATSMTESASYQKLIYSNNNLVPFNEVQDYTVQQYGSIVRLETADHQFFCSGTVISDDYVLTAAHCLMRGRYVPKLMKENINIVSVNKVGGRNQIVLSKAGAVNTRADYALVRGNFKGFTKARILYHPDMFAELRGPFATCGFPWGAEVVCYQTGNRYATYYDHFAVEGRLYPGMSGGPVVDLGAQGIFAINSAVSDGAIILAPLIGIFETLGVRVIKAGESE